VTIRNQYTNLTLLIAGILVIFVVRGLLATTITVPYTFHLFDTLTVVGAWFILLKGYRNL
jgi:hypothetical protein